MYIKNLVYICILLLFTFQCIECKVLTSFVENYEESQLRIILFDGQTKTVYLSTKNYLYYLDSDDLSEKMPELKTGPKKDSPLCPNDPDIECPYRELKNSYAQTMNIHSMSARHLILCFNLLGGYCSKVEIESFSFIEHIYESVVPTSQRKSAIILFNPNENPDSLFYVASSQGPTLRSNAMTRSNEGREKSRANGAPKSNVSNVNLPLLSARDYSSFLKFDSIDIQPSFLEWFPIDFVGGFSYKGISYFFSNHPTIFTKPSDSTSPISTEVHIMRICENSRILIKSFVEVKVSCNIGGVDYSFLKDIVVKKNDKNDGNPDIFGIFWKNRYQIDGSTAVCAFHWSDIDITFQMAINACFKGLTETGPKYLPNTGVKCQTFANANVGQSYCGNFDKNFPIYGNDPVKPFYAANLKQGLAYAIDIEDINNYLVAFVGFSNGILGKFKAVNTTDQVVNLGNIQMPKDFSSTILDLQIGSNQDIYVLTDTKLFRVKINDCESSNECSQCVADPHCGWCLITNSCTVSDKCVKNNVANAWLSDVCLEFTSAPNQVASNQLHMSEFSVLLNYIAPVSIVKKCILEGTNFKFQMVSAVNILFGGKFKLNCAPFQSINNLLVPFVNASLKIMIDSVIWSESYVIIYSCEEINSCTSCINLSFGCQWCAATNKCMAPNSGTCSSGIINSSLICPRIDLNPGQKFIRHCDEQSDYDVVGRYLYKSFITTLKCGFNVNGSIFSTQAIIQEPSQEQISVLSNVKCNLLKLNFQGTIGKQLVPISLFWMDGQRERFLDNPNNISVELYKCENLAPTCGQCISLNLDYKCIWCGSACSFINNCKMSPVVDRNGICPNPSITSIWPLGGPLNGGTLLTVNGTDLGLDSNSLNVLIDKKPCIVKTVIVRSQSFQCITSALTGALTLQAPIVVKVSNLYTTSSIQKFEYKDPKFTDLVPKEGLISSKTRVAILGSYLNYGSQYNVTIGKVNAPVISRNSTHLIVDAPTQSSSIQAKVFVSVDKMAQKELIEKYQYLENPDVTDFDPKISFISGGTEIELTGRNFRNIKSYINPEMIVYIGDLNQTSNCEVKDESKMICQTPNLRNILVDSNIGFALDFGLIVGTVKFLLNLQTKYAPLKQIQYYTDPALTPMSAPIIYEKDKIIEVNVSNVYSLKKFDHVHLEVSGVQIEKIKDKDLKDKSKLLFKLPNLSPKPDEGDTGDLEFVIGNFRQKIATLKYPNNKSANVAGIICLVLGLLLLVVLTIFIVYCITRRRKKKLRRDVITLPGLVQHRTQSSSNPYAETNPNAAERWPLTNGEPLDIKDEHYFENLMKRIEMNDEVSLTGKEDIFITRERLELGRLIGRGHFGSVFAATLRDANMKNPFPVAVKTIDDADLKQEAVENFLKEGLIMKDFNHPHVLSLYGLCLGYKKEPMVILPFMSNGDLRSYVKDSKKSFTARQLLGFVQQVSMGMAYLSGLNFIHRDLASRNCMIDDKGKVKVADFGLSHQLHDREYYSTKDHKAKLPIKWMAIESLENFTFTTKSDVWSFGVLMWEVMTRGITPYADVQVFEIRDYLSTGRRLRKPKYCPDNVYDIMKSCWLEQPERRPSFADLVNQLEVLLNPPKTRTQESESDDEHKYLNTDEHAAGAQVYLMPKTNASSTV